MSIMDNKFNMSKSGIKKEYTFIGIFRMYFRY